MAKDVDLNSKQWLDLVFESKNKKFGAYELRESSSRRHIWAIVIVVIAIVALVFLPKLIKQSSTTLPNEPVIQQGVIEFTDVDPLVAPKMPMTEVVVQAPATLTPIQRTIGFSEPVIVTEVRPEASTMLTQDEITNSNAAIGTTTNEDGAIVGIHPDDPAAAANNAVLPKEEGPRTVAEVWPKFKGDLMKWLSNNLRYPVDALESGQEGRVILRFVVQSDGTIGNVEVLQRFFPSCDREAVRVVSKMPKWIPGLQGEEPVAVYYTLPIHFRIQK